MTVRNMPLESISENYTLSKDSQSGGREEGLLLTSDNVPSCQLSTSDSGYLLCRDKHTIQRFLLMFIAVALRVPSHVYSSCHADTWSEEDKTFKALSFTKMKPHHCWRLKGFCSLVYPSISHVGTTEFLLR